MFTVFFKRWVLWILPEEISLWILGLLELTNGCIALKDISSDGMKLVMSCGILSFGGLCVWMQTVSVTKELGTGMYLPGKLLQSCISILLAGAVQLFMERTSGSALPVIMYLGVFFLLVLLILSSRSKKKVVALWG